MINHLSTDLHKYDKCTNGDNTSMYGIQSRIPNSKAFLSNGPSAFFIMYLQMIRVPLCNSHMKGNFSLDSIFNVQVEIDLLC